MAPTREKRRPFWLLRAMGSDAEEAVALDARDVPSAWRRAEREAADEPFALYGPDRALIRVGLPPPLPFARLSGATAVALTPDGERLVVGHAGCVRVYDAIRGTLLWERSLGNSPVDAFVLPRRANWLVACTRAGEVWVLDRDRGEPLLHVADDDARAVALSPDDRVLALAGVIVDLWSLPEGVRLASLDLDVAAAIHGARAIDDAIEDDDDAVNEGVYAVGFAGDGEHVVGVRSRQGGEIVIWNARTGNRVAARAGVSVQRLVVAQSGQGVLVRVHDDASVVRSIEVPSLRCSKVMVTGAEGLWDLRLTPDGRFVLAHDEETGLYVVDRATGEPHAWLDEFEACAYVVRGARVADRARRRKETPVGSDDTHVIALPRWGRNDPGAPVSADGRRYAALRRHHDERLVAIFDLARCTPYAALAHAAPALSVWLDRTGRHAATRDADGRVFVWSLPDAPPTLP